MKKCPYCGAEYPDDAIVCALDQTSLDSPPPSRPVSLGVMTRPLPKIAIWIAVVAFALIVIGSILFPRFDNNVNSQLLGEMSGMKQIGTKLRYYADEHKTLPGGAETGKSVNSLVTAGILSPSDAVYIREHHIEFRGFDPSRIGSDVVVMETVFTNTERSRRIVGIVGYSDGSVVVHDLHKTQ